MKPPASHTASPSVSSTAESTRKAHQSRGPRANRAQKERQAASDPGSRHRADGQRNFILRTCTELTLVCLPPGPAPRHSLEDAAQLTGVHPELVRYYCRLGLLDARPGALTGEPTLDNDGLEEISRIEHFRRYLGVHRRALPLICQLRRECERMQIKLAFLGDTWSEGAWGRRM